MNLTIYWGLSVAGLVIMYLIPKLLLTKNEKVLYTIKVVGLLVSLFAVVNLLKNGVL